MYQRLSQPLAWIRKVLTVNTSAIENRPLTNRELFWGVIKCRFIPGSFLGKCCYLFLFLINAPLFYAVQEGLIKERGHVDPTYIQIAAFYCAGFFFSDINARYIQVSPAKLAFFDTCILIIWFLGAPAIVGGLIEYRYVQLVAGIFFAIGVPCHWLLYRRQQQSLGTDLVGTRI